MGVPQNISATEDENSVSVSYNSWLLKHPSALYTFEHMMSIAKGKKIVVFLDYDGTLSNIVDNPEKAFMTNEVHDFVNLDTVYYAGSHGLDIAAPLQSPNYGDPKHQTRVVDGKGNEVVLFQPAKKYLPAIQRIFSALSEKTRSIRGVMLEHNKFCISVHFRHVRDEVFEIRPDMEWDKGHALNYLLDTLGYGSSSDVLPLYIGDDRTDEDAFKAIRNRGKGFPIVVSSTPKDTMALHSLCNPLEVNEFLIRLVKWRKNSASSKFFCQNLEGKIRKERQIVPVNFAK
ncbi:trehalose-6-phosphate phosphatase [Actinidia rufa]|uniref:Trehalose-6-phosphate phosphatase n=1 Tax=Actinidia rufa TaxID=165716 RepID=A0A7J0EUT2_9ERIC|nr:trehalose-6-phosphate phosphatase [Actinidia rufa]